METKIQCVNVESNQNRRKQWIGEHINNLKQGLMEKSRLAKHAYEEGHSIQWKEAKAVHIEANIICRKYKEAAHMACNTNPISQLSLEISPI
jgi:hypothetical protein